MRLKPGPKADVSGDATGCVTAEDPRGQPTRTAATLTAAETRVLGLITQAKTNKEIAQALGISPATVKRHLENVLRKLGLRNRVEAAIYALSIHCCSGASDSRCALRVWCKERETARPAWAD